MERKLKSYGRDVIKANAQEDISLINQYTLRELRPEEVFCFNVVLCDNEVDRDYERFSIGALEQLAKLSIGKTGIMDHNWTAQNQLARCYAAKVEKVEGRKNRLGEQLYRLRASAYMLKNEATRPIVAAVEGGILKEVSVGFAAKSCNCSICGKPLRGGECESGHVKGERSVSGLLCVGSLEDITDAFEFSFVAVPAQRGAGVTKTAKKPVKKVATASEEVKLPPPPSVPRSKHSISSVRYAVINEKHVYDGDLKAAWTAAGFARKELKMPPIRICWYVPEVEANAKGWNVVGTFEHDNLLAGLQDPTIHNTIFIRYTGNTTEMQKAVCHELFHVKQSMRGRIMSEEQEELSASNYEKDAGRRLWNLSRKDAEDILFQETCCTDWSKA